MATELTFEIAKTLAISLTSIKGYPRHADAITAIALDLMDWCKGALIGQRFYTPEQQAQMIVQEARLTWLEWTSMADLRALFRQRFDPEPEYSLERQFGKQRELDCKLCNETGVKRTAAGTDAFCECEYGQAARRSCPRLLDLCNGHSMPAARSKRLALVTSTTEQSAVASMIAFNEATLNNPAASKREKLLAKKVLSRFKPAAEAS